MPWLCCYQPTPRSTANQPRAARTVPPAATDELKPLVLHTQAAAEALAPRVPLARPPGAGAPVKWRPPPLVIGESKGEIPGMVEAVTPAAKRTALVNRLLANRATDLPSIDKFAGTPSNTQIVLPGQSLFFHVGTHPPCFGYYAAAASEDLILVGVAKHGAEPVACSLAYVQAKRSVAATQDTFEDFFARFQREAPGLPVQVLLVAGNKETARRALQAADRHKASVAFADAGHSPGFGYTLALDRECNAYFGENDALDDATCDAIAERRAQSNVRRFFP